MAAIFRFSVALHVWAAVAAATLVRAAEEEDRPVPPELQGTWNICRLVVDGTVALAQETPGFQLVFGEQRLSYHMVVNGKPFQADFALTLGDDRRSLDARLLNGGVGGRLCLGIYEVQGDTLKICLEDVTRACQGRPETFEGRPGQRLHVFHLRRSTPNSGMTRGEL